MIQDRFADTNGEQMKDQQEKNLTARGHKETCIQQDLART